MTKVQRMFPWVVGVLAAAFVAAAVVRGGGGSKENAVDWDAVARIPVTADGRVKPLDTFARNSLMKISGRQTFDRGEGQGRGEAVEWLLELMATPKVAGTRRVFRIDHPGVVSLLEVDDPGRTRFALQEIAPHIEELMNQAEKAGAVLAKERDPFQREVVQLENRLVLYLRIARMETPFAIRPMAEGEEWRPLAVVLRDPDLSTHPSAKAVIGVLAKHSEGDVQGINEAARGYAALIASTRDARHAWYEVVFNRAQPFYQASVLYVLAFVLGCAALLIRPLSAQGWWTAVRRAAVAVIAVAFVVHTVGILTRIGLQGRPPVTNLYSSAVFIGWAGILLAMAGEWFHRLGLASMVASLIGFGTLVVAHNLSSGGDTMEMMQAVLDTNFWLATHVVIVTIGYSSTFLAGLMAVVYILAGVLTPLLRGEPVRALPKMIYGVICFASVASFVGTVLGGIWADQSWGRFWGWDPKENGAALIVLWNLTILHARWGGMIRERGVAAMAVGGNIVTAWSWFGTNMLGVGLHSYGFMDSAVFALVAFCVAQVAVMAVAIVPQARWRSLRAASVASQPADASPVGVATPNLNPANL